MSNFICPHCQQIIDDGSDGFTSNREIELEKQLEIAVKALDFYEKPIVCFYPEYNIAQHLKKAAEALAKIKELDK